ncbi:hypothetical protein H9P43_004881 [Blastocladiella emersonii ATCC 22665]|nr:hypothetical protein H9P43_004881 [Blastocladiella emersonii ATCC 22665]
MKTRSATRAEAAAAAAAAAVTAAVPFSATTVFSIPALVPPPPVLSAASASGRKHANVLHDEDGSCSVSVALDAARVRANLAHLWGLGKHSVGADFATTPIPTHASVAVVVDGHGARGSGDAPSVAAQIVAHLFAMLPAFLARLLHLDFEVLGAETATLECIANALAGPTPPAAAVVAARYPLPRSRTASAMDVDVDVDGDNDTPPLRDPPNAYLDAVHHTLHHLRDLLNARLRQTPAAPHLADAGCTLCLAVRLGDTLLCANVGDSSMVLLGPGESVLPVWSTRCLTHPACPTHAARLAAHPLAPDALAAPQMGLPTSYEDAVCHFPREVRPGQTQPLARIDFESLKPHLKRRRGSYVLSAPGTTHLLRMTNSVANLAHVPVFLPRTTVYRFSVPDLLAAAAAAASASADDGGSQTSLPSPPTEHPPAAAPLTLVMMTDGVRDVLPQVDDLARISAALREGVTAAHDLLVQWATNGGKWRPKHAKRPPSRARDDGNGNDDDGYEDVESEDETTAPPPPASDPPVSPARASGAGSMRASRLTGALQRVARTFAPFQAPDAQCEAAAKSLAALWMGRLATGDLSPADHADLLAASVVQLAVLRSTADDATCIAWRLDASGGEPVPAPRPRRGMVNEYPESHVTVHHVRATCAASIAGAGC